MNKVLALQEENEFILDEKGYKLHPNAISIKYMIKDKCFICISHKTNKNGYPILIRHGKFYLMNRYVYETYKSLIGEGLLVMHTCDNPRCINPDHLNLGTHADNMKDMKIKGRAGGPKGQKQSEEHKNKITETKKKLTNEQALKIKELLLEKTNESIRDKDVRISKLFNVSPRTIGKIRGGETIYNEFLGGSMKDWLKLQ